LHSHPYALCARSFRCDSDLTKLLYEPQAADPGGTYTAVAQICELMEHIAHGLVYIHREKVPHLDLKPDNVLLAKGVDDKWVAKLADFGMAYEDNGSQAVGTSSVTTGGSAPQTPQVADSQKIDSLDKIAAFGTWEYLSPECYKRKYGTPCCKSDIFSFGVMIWEMVARTRPYKAFPGFEDDDEAPTVWNSELQKHAVDVSLIAERLARGQRPLASAKCPAVLHLLMQACWVHDAPKRPTAADVLQMIRRMLTDEQEHLLAVEEDAAVSAQPEPETEAVVSYGDWLTEHDFADKLDQLGDWDIKEPAPGSPEAPPLEKLQTMLTEEEEDDNEDLQDMLDDLFGEDDKETQTRFRDAVAALNGDVEGRAVAEAATASDPWTELRLVLGSSDADEESNAMESIVRAQGEEIALLKAAAAQDQSIVRALGEENAQLKARLAAFEAEP
jgi:serine/threonine protein kinase